MSLHPSSPPTKRQRASPPPPEQDRESSLSRLIIAPLIFLSFLLSLFLIDTHATSSRQRDRANRATGGWLSALLWRPKAGSPYAYVGGGIGKGGREEEWVWHTKQRKMLRMEVVDAFELRRWVVGALGVVVVVLGGAGWWVGRWVWGRWGFW